MDITGIGSIADLAKGIIDKIWPDKTQKEKDDMAQAMLLLQGAIDEAKGQQEINKIEAASSNVFVAGWRPFIGWVCGSAFAYNWVVLPLITSVAAAFGHPVEGLKPLNFSEMSPVLLGMLGLGGYRTFEKVKQVAS